MSITVRGPKTATREAHRRGASFLPGICYGRDNCFEQACAVLGLYDVAFYGVKGSKGQMRQIHDIWHECMKLHGLEDA